MTRARMLVIALGVALVALVAGIGVAQHFLAPSPPRSAEAFFGHTFNDLGGRPESMTRWRGQLVLVNFWATWCAPCVEEMPLLQTISDDYRARGLAVVGLGIDAPSALRSFRDEHRLTIPLYAAGAQGSDLARALGNDLGALPYTVLVDRNGRIVATRLGALKAAELRGWIDRQLASGAS